MTLALAIWSLLVAFVYTAIYIIDPAVAQALVVLFVALLIVPAIWHELGYVKRRRRRRSDHAR